MASSIDILEGVTFDSDPTFIKMVKIKAHVSVVIFKFGQNLWCYCSGEGTFSLIKKYLVITLIAL